MIGPRARRPDPGVVPEMLARGPRPVADPQFRNRLRADFIADTIAVPVRHAARTSARPSAPPMANPSALPGRRLTWPIPVAALTAAAALTIVFLLNYGQHWRLSASAGAAAVRIDGFAVPLNRPAEISRRLRPGAVVVLPDSGQLDLELPGMAVLQIVGGSRITIPRSPGRWFGRSMSASLDLGELRISTTPGFRGTRLDVITPEVRATVTGTTLAVIRRPDASCVCVFEGGVAMSGVDSTVTVPAGFRRSVYRDGRAPFIEPILPMETMKLGMLRDQVARSQQR